MSDKVKVGSGGIGIFGLLGVIFVTLKLLGLGAVASWSWWLVLAPFWGPVAFVIVCFIAGLLIAMTGLAIGGLYKAWKDRG